MVIDWRAPVSLPFYRASKVEPMGVELRRRFGFQHGRLTAFEDEDLATPGEWRSTPRSSRPRSSGRAWGPMRDIVATIQPEQDVIVRSDLPHGLRAGRPRHRQDRRRPAPRGVPALRAPRAAHPPGRAGGRAERELPALHPRRAAALGEIDAKQSTIEELVAKPCRPGPARPGSGWPIRGEDAGRRGHAQGRRPAGRGARAGAVVARAGADRGAGRPAGGAAVAGRDVRGRGADRDAARARGAVRRRAGPWCRSASRTGSWCRWSSPATPPTTGCRTRWRGAGR